MASSEQPEPFTQLSEALDHLFEGYEELKQSLASLANSVLKIPNDPRDQAINISIFGIEMRHNLKSYLDFLKEMSTAMAQTDSSECKFQAGLALDTMELLNKRVQAEGVALEAVVNKLRQTEEEEKESGPDVDKVVKNALEEASQIIQGIALGLLKYIKEQLRQAFDDTELLITSGALKQEVEEVKKTIPAVLTACDENISALKNIISTMDRLSKEENEESYIESLKKNAQALGKTCDDKLPSVEAESRLRRPIAQSAQVTSPPK